MRRSKREETKSKLKRQEKEANARRKKKRRSKTFTGTLFRSGRGNVSEIWRLPFGTSFVLVQTAKGFRPRARVVLTGMVRCGEGNVFEAWGLEPNSH